MKVRPKALMMWPGFAIGFLVCSLLTFFGASEWASFFEVCAALCAIAIAVVMVGFVSVYWELTPDRLIVRKLWRKIEIPWTDVTEVGWLGSMPGTFRINVGHRTEDYDRIYMKPGDPCALNAALRRFAPHANFDL